MQKEKKKRKVDVIMCIPGDFQGMGMAGIIQGYFGTISAQSEIL